jgi:uncharacterized damage-inducible protein DinB
MIGAAELRNLYDYHFTLNHRLWNHSVMALTEDQYLQQTDYSVGSVRNQLVHLMNIEDRWFSGLRGVEVPGFINPVHYHTREKLRQKWDEVEANIQAYINRLPDDDISKVYDGPFQVWQVLLHVINHATDHRAQTFALLHSLGAPTFPQDYAFVVMGIDTTQPKK